jgi:hypothetical protein
MKSQKIKKALSISNVTAQPFYPTIADCIRWTELLNYIMFNGAIPKWRKVSVKKLRNIWGRCIPYYSPVRYKKSCSLEMHSKFDSFATFYSILAHELIHAAEFHQYDTCDHGDFFYNHKEMLKFWGIKLNESYKSK